MWKLSRTKSVPCNPLGRVNSILKAIIARTPIRIRIPIPKSTLTPASSQTYTPTIHKKKRIQAPETMAPDLFLSFQKEMSFLKARKLKIECSKETIIVMTNTMGFVSANICFGFRFMGWDIHRRGKNGDRVRNRGSRGAGGDQEEAVRGHGGRVTTQRQINRV